MIELHDTAIQLLRANGFSDDEIAELGRTGSLTRTDASGATMQVTSSGASSVQVNGVEVGAGTIPPETIAMLRTFHRLMPKETVHHVEALSGEDIDEDGVVGQPGAGRPAPRAAAAIAERDHAGSRIASPSANAMPGGGDPFVRPSAGRRLAPVLLILVVVLGVAVYYATSR